MSLRARRSPLSAAAVLRARRRLQRSQPDPSAFPDWWLRHRTICASTERELEAWLTAVPPDCARSAAFAPRAVLASRQRFGQGQRGRPWQSPAGGVWLSAALPWALPPPRGAAVGLAVAVGLALELEALGLTVQLKWPNDLLVEGQKIAGLLPRLRLRGEQVRWAQVGVGLNGINPVPPGAISVATALAATQPSWRGSAAARATAPAGLAARLLRGLEWATTHALAPGRVLREARQRLLLPVAPVLHGGVAWQAVDLAMDGSLVLERGAERTLLQRRF